MILAADVGGTKTLLGLFREADGKLRNEHETSLPSQEFPSFEAIVDAFLSVARPRARVRRAGVGVAGPVVGGRSQRVNLPWPIDATRLARHLGLDDVQLVNDVEATAWGIPELPPSKLVSLTPGVRPRPGNAALIAAGTGLGMALMFWDGARHRPSASEGGHQEFAPRDDLEIDLLRLLRAEHGRVSVERVVAGPGIEALYRFLVDTGRAKESPEMKRRLAAAEDRNRIVAEAALSGSDAASTAALDRFVSLYGSAAGDLALVARAVAGVYVGGGIAPRILPRLESGEFVRSFRAKGRLTPLVESIPVRVITEPRTALLGAAACARSRMEKGRTTRKGKR